MTGLGKKKRRGGFLNDLFKTIANPSSWGQKIGEEILNPNSVSKQLYKLSQTGMGKRRRGRGVTTMPYFG